MNTESYLRAFIAGILIVLAIILYNRLPNRIAPENTTNVVTITPATIPAGSYNENGTIYYSSQYNDAVFQSFYKDTKYPLTDKLKQSIFKTTDTKEIKTIIEKHDTIRAIMFFENGIMTKVMISVPKAYKPAYIP